MNLLQLLLSSMANTSSVNSAAKKTGLSEVLVKKLIIAAIPLLIKYMTKNASSQGGALSLLGALTQHTSNRSMAQQIEEVDEKDGDKIIGHILGEDKDTVVKELAAETGATNEQVTRGLASIAPALLSGLSAAANAAKPANNAQAGALDLSGLLGMFAGGQQQAASSNDLLSALLGGGSAQPVQQAQPQSSGLLNLFGLAPQQTQQVQQQTAADPLSSLFGSLLGAPAQTAQQTQPQNAIPLTGNTSANTSALDGSALLNILSQFMK
ncbi:MAG: DUF937 domain-containing protein [Solobacterium sp.]|nr:DUF937 domain-containing protein [Solobacterium sp.]